MIAQLHARSLAAGLGTLLLLAACGATPPAKEPERMVGIADRNGAVAPHRADTIIEATAQQAPDPAAFEQLLAITGALSDTPLYDDSRVQLLIDGPATYAAMLESIRSASRVILLETYIFADDEIGQKFAQQLIAKSQQGVQVRIIYDSLGSVTSKDSFFESMQAAGIEIIEFHNLNPLEGGNPLNFNVRDHRKLLMVDGTVAYTGGINLSNTYSSSSKDRKRKDPKADGWRDTHIAVYGPAVQGFEKIFRDNWTEHGGKPFDLTEAESGHNAAGEEIVAVLSAQGGDGEESPIFHAYLDAMKVARHRIWITQAYFAPDEGFLDELGDAARRGVDVRVIVPGVSDSQLVLNASRSRYGRLLEAGVRIYESNSSLLHAKTAVIDGIWSTVGSSNLDYRSFLHNDEVNAVVFGVSFARSLEDQFLDDIAESRAISLDEWHDRSLFKRVKEWISWPLEYWL